MLGHFPIRIDELFTGRLSAPKRIPEDRGFYFSSHVLGAYMMTIMPPKQRMAPIVS